MSDQLTQCPHCQTSFRVTSGQLAAADGLVRCGACLGLFSAAINAIRVKPEAHKAGRPGSATHDSDDILLGDLDLSAPPLMDAVDPDDAADDSDLLFSDPRPPRRPDAESFEPYEEYAESVDPFAATTPPAPAAQAWDELPTAGPLWSSAENGEDSSPASAAAPEPEAEPALAEDPAPVSGPSEEFEPPAVLFDDDDDEAEDDTFDSPATLTDVLPATETEAAAGATDNSSTEAGASPRPEPAAPTAFRALPAFGNLASMVAANDEQPFDATAPLTAAADTEAEVEANANDAPVLHDTVVFDTEAAAEPVASVDDEPGLAAEPAVDDEPGPEAEPAVDDEPDLETEPAPDDSPDFDDEPARDDAPGFAAVADLVDAPESEATPDAMLAELLAEDDGRREPTFGDLEEAESILEEYYEDCAATEEDDADAGAAGEYDEYSSEGQEAEADSTTYEYDDASGSVTDDYDDEDSEYEDAPRPSRIPAWLQRRASVPPEKAALHDYLSTLEDEEELDPLEPEQLDELLEEPVLLADASGNRSLLRKLAWGLLSLLLVLALLLQFTHRHLDALRQRAAFAPFEPLACALFDCPPAAHAAQPASAALQSEELLVRSHPRIPGALELSFVFRNDGDAAAPFPGLELSFKDEQQQLLARRLLLPADYLPPELRSLDRMPGHSSVQVQLELLDPGASAVNYSIAFRDL